MAQYRVTAIFLIRALPKNARRKAEEVLRRAELEEGEVVKVCKLTRRKPRRRRTVAGRQRERRRKLEVVDANNARLTPVQVWRAVRKGAPRMGSVPTKMPTVLVRASYDAPATADVSGWKVHVPPRVDDTTLAHVFLHCARGAYHNDVHSVSFCNAQDETFRALIMAARERQHKRRDMEYRRSFQE